MQGSNSYWIGVLLGGFIVGAVCGIAPLVGGIIKQNRKLGIIGMISCMVSGLVLGLLLAVPVAIIFTLIITLRKNNDKSFTAPPDPPQF